MRMCSNKFLSILFLFSFIAVITSNPSESSGSDRITITRFTITTPTDIILWVSNVFNRLINTLVLNNEGNIGDESKGVTKTSQTLNKLSDISSANCGLSRKLDLGLVDNKIVRGKDASRGQFPWQLLLRIIDAQNVTFLCGGSLITSNWILTAAHCVTNEKNGELSVKNIDAFAGAVIRKPLEKNNELQRRSVDCVIPNQKWKGRLGALSNDIALLRIPSDNPFNITFPFGGNVNTMCLPPAISPPFEYTGKATVAGWGLTRDRLLFGQPSDVLKYTTVTTIEDKTCRLYPIIGEDVVDSMICQGIDRTAPCQGDSGGPLIIYPNNKERALQIGIVSFGPGFCANSFIPNTIYTQVSYFTDWIENTIKSNDGDSKCPTNQLSIATSAVSAVTTESGVTLKIIPEIMPAIIDTEEDKPNNSF